MDEMVKRCIENCSLVCEYGHPGYEDEMCAGFRSDNGGGEVIRECKACTMYYLFEVRF